jgi:hypothetical protein
MPVFSGSNAFIEADYTKSKVEIYQQVVSLALPQTLSLEFLSAVEHDETINNKIPSWLPFWDQPQLRSVILYPHTTENNAALNTIPSIAIDPAAHILRARGIKLDKITESKTTYLQTNSSPDDLSNAEKMGLLLYCVEAINRTSHYLLGEKMIDVI